MLNSSSTLLIQMALIIALPVAHAAMYAPQAAYMTELFPTRVRFSGISLASQIASVLAGALSPFIATLLLGRYGFGAIAAYMMLMATITTAAVLWSPETAGRSLTTRGPVGDPAGSESRARMTSAK
jgi:MFS family permease